MPMKRVASDPRSRAVACRSLAVADQIAVRRTAESRSSRRLMQRRKGFCRKAGRADQQNTARGLFENDASRSLNGADAGSPSPTITAVSRHSPERLPKRQRQPDRAAVISGSSRAR